MQGITLDTKKKKVMGKDHLGKPSGIDKSESLGMGSQSNIVPDEKYISPKDELQEGIREMHPNRNTTRSSNLRAAKR